MAAPTPIRKVRGWLNGTPSIETSGMPPERDRARSILKGIGHEISLVIELGGGNSRQPNLCLAGIALEGPLYGTTSLVMRGGQDTRFRLCVGNVIV